MGKKKWSEESSREEWERGQRFHQSDKTRRLTRIIAKEEDLVQQSFELLRGEKFVPVKTFCKEFFPEAHFRGHQVFLFISFSYFFQPKMSIDGAYVCFQNSRIQLFMPLSEEVELSVYRPYSGPDGGALSGVLTIPYTIRKNVYYTLKSHVSPVLNIYVYCLIMLLMSTTSSND